MPVTNARLNANRRNAQHSTGPRTPEGKARAALNALRHGLCAERPVIRELEDAALYRQIHDQLLREWRPASVLEIMLVEQIAQLVWRLRRAASVEAEAIENLPNERYMGRMPTSKTPPERALVRDLSRQSPMLLRMQTYQMRLERSLRNALTDLRRLQQERLAMDETEPADDAEEILELQESQPAEPASELDPAEGPSVNDAPVTDCATTNLQASDFPVIATPVIETQVTPASNENEGTNPPDNLTVAPAPAGTASFPAVSRVPTHSFRVCRGPLRSAAGCTPIVTNAATRLISPY